MNSLKITPVIIPVNSTKTVECILHDGRKYCERSDDGWAPLLVIPLLFLWVASWLYVAHRAMDSSGGKIPGWAWILLVPVILITGPLFMPIAILLTKETTNEQA